MYRIAINFQFEIEAGAARKWFLLQEQLLFSRWQHDISRLRCQMRAEFMLILHYNFRIAKIANSLLCRSIWHARDTIAVTNAKQYEARRRYVGCGIIYVSFSRRSYFAHTDRNALARRQSDNTRNINFADSLEQVPVGSLFNLASYANHSVIVDWKQNCKCGGIWRFWRKSPDSF